MGRGSSKAGGGSANGGAAGGAGLAKNGSISGKPFNRNDWKTWPVGTEVRWYGDEKVGSSQYYRAKVTQVVGGNDPHLIVTTTHYVNGNTVTPDNPPMKLWVDDSGANKYVAVKK